MAILTKESFMAKSGMAHGQKLSVNINGKEFFIQNVNGFPSYMKNGNNKSGHFDVYDATNHHNIKLIKSYRYGDGMGEGTEEQVFAKLKREIVRL